MPTDVRKPPQTQRDTDRRIEDLYLEGAASGRAKGSVASLFRRLHRSLDERTREKKPGLNGSLRK